MMKKNIVVIGGGHGLAAILRGLKNIKNVNISAIVTVADDGGSTGRLKARYNIPAVGDVRNVITALAKSETLLSQLMDYRFSGASDVEDDVQGHSLGNLILTALTQTSGSFMEAIGKVSKVLNVQGNIIPSTSEVVTLFAEMEDGTIVAGESNIPIINNVIKRVYYQHQVKATEEAIVAIDQADIIVLGIGSLYTSVLPNLIIGDISHAINRSHAKKIYLCNAMSESGETDHYTVDNHVQAIEKHLKGTIDIVIYPNDIIPEEVLENYRRENAEVVYLDNSINPKYQVCTADLLRFDNQQVRHDSEKIENLFREIIKE